MTLERELANTLRKLVETLKISMPNIDRQYTGRGDSNALNRTATERAYEQAKQVLRRYNETRSPEKLHL